MFDFLNKNNNNQKKMLDPEFIPNHIAIIMDGNGRWARKKHLPRIAGHRQGMENVKIITKAVNNLGVKVLTLYAFSTENWKRPDKEVSFLMDLPVKFFNTFVPELVENNVKVQVMGYLDELPQATQKAVNDAIEQTSHCTGMILNFALNYGSQAEIISAVKNVAKKVKSKLLSEEDISEEIFAKELMTHSLTPYDNPDLLIRTSGEERISNFLLWQLAYSELVFTDTLWPDYIEEDLIANIVEYQHRDRRFGGLKEENVK